LGIAAEGGSGAAYVTGVTYSSDFPTTPGAFDTTHNGNHDAFMAKLNATGSALAYAAFLGGSGDDIGYGIAIDGSGAAYITGHTNSSDFPTTPGAFDTTFNGGYDAFVVKLAVGGGNTLFISGRVTDGSSNPISGVAVSAGAGGSATTDANGYYTITDLSNGTYTLTPTKSGYTFSPPSRTVSVPPDATGQDFTGSAVVSSVDMGFRPNPNGYKFPNYSGLYPLTPAEYSIDEAIRMFGQDAVCQTTLGGVCFPKFGVIQWIAMVNWMMSNGLNGGHCDGMASTSLRFFKGKDKPSDFQAGASTTHDLDLESVRRHIAYYFVEQLTDPVGAYKETVRQNTPSAILSQLYSAISGGASDPTTLFVRQAGHGGHAITPYAIEDRGNGVYWVKVYDNNWVDDANRHVVITTTTENWSYDLGGTLGTWSGDASSHTMGSTLAASIMMPSGTVWLNGGGHLLLTDSQGRRLGYVGGQFMSEIPGAFGRIVDTGSGVESEPIYTLPLSDTYTILLDGQTLTQTDAVAITQFGPGYAVTADGVTMNQTSQDRLTVAPDGMQLAYRSSEIKAITLTLALDGLSESDQFQIKNASVGTGQIVTLTNQTISGSLKFDNSRASGGQYSLEIKRVGAAGEQRFVHAGIVISATDTQYAVYGSWNGSAGMTLQIDHGSDGTIDETLVLNNQAWQVYLPLVIRNQ
jgi:hypothetical protein